MTGVGTASLPRGTGPIARLAEYEPRLTWFGTLLWVAMLPVAVALVLDDRTLRDANIWYKPLKFLLSVGLFALTTAWYIGQLPVARRAAPRVRRVVWIVLVAGTFEIVYIVLQAALGQASHYNVGDTLHTVLYGLMGVGAIALCVSHGMLAREIRAHAQAPVGAFRTALVIGLWCTCILGILSGMPLATFQPPPASNIPVLGWHLISDLRPAHFLGMHANQLLPLAALALERVSPRHARRWLLALVPVYLIAWLVLMLVAMHGAGLY